MKISLETVQNAIPDDTAVVEYFSDSGPVWTDAA